MPRPVPIPAGELRHVITIAQANTTEDGFGGSDSGMAGSTAVAVVRAKIEALTLREIYAAQQKVSEVTHRVTVRWMDGVRAGMLVWFQGRQFQIQDVSNVDERNIRLELLCLERDDSAREEGLGEGAPGSITTGAGGGSGSGVTPSAGGLVTEKFTADGSTNVFTLHGSPVGTVLWYRNGALQVSPDDYSQSGAQITVALTPEEIAGDTFMAIYL